MGFDGVELVMAWEETFGVTILDAEASSLRTPRMATDLICRKLGVSDSVGINGGDSPILTDLPVAGACLSQRAFYRVREALGTAFGTPRAHVRPNTAFEDVLPAGQRRQRWRILQAAVGVATFPKTLFGWAMPSTKTVGGLARWLIANYPNHFRRVRERWTRTQVHAVLRAVITEQLGIYEFGDDDDFVRDLGID